MNERHKVDSKEVGLVIGLILGKHLFGSEDTTADRYGFGKIAQSPGCLIPAAHYNSVYNTTHHTNSLVDMSLYYIRIYKINK